jgi:hypothetical protein
MKSTVAAAAAIALALAATTASAGVVISQNLVVNNPAATPKVNKTTQTVMVQGHKQKVITDELEVITDLDAGKIYFLRPATKGYFEQEFPPTGMFARRMQREGAFVGFKKFAGSHKKLSGYSCQDYGGGSQVPYADVGVIECVAADAPGAKEYVEFRKAMTQKLKGTALEPKGEIPDGIPVASITSTTPVVTPATGGIPPELIAKLKATAVKNKITSAFNVSKIEVKNLADSEFVVPANYVKQEPQLPQFSTETNPAAPGAEPPAPASSTKPGAPAAPKPQAAPVPH